MRDREEMLNDSLPRGMGELAGCAYKAKFQFENGNLDGSRSTLYGLRGSLTAIIQNLEELEELE